MTSRFETKFLVSHAQRYVLRERLGAVLGRDPHVVSQGRYPVLTQYFDTDGGHFYSQKVDGDFEHVKVRARKYSRDLRDSADGFLEAKIKHGQQQRKIRVRLAADRLLDPGRWRGGELEYFESLLARTPLQPTCNVYYEREAMELTEPNGTTTRLNFDTDLLALTPDETVVTGDLAATRNVLPAGVAVLEVKTEGERAPSVVVGELRGLGAAALTCSKYVMCLDFLESHRHSWRP